MKRVSIYEVLATCVRLTHLAVGHFRVAGYVLLSLTFKTSKVLLKIMQSGDSLNTTVIAHAQSLLRLNMLLPNN